MKDFYNTVVIGAGPAGAACGITLAKSGADVCLIDKAVFPRSKTCAGLVTGKTYRLIEQLFGKTPDESLFCAGASRVALFKKSKCLVEAELHTPVRLVNRKHFDNALVERYRALGGELLEGEQVTLDTKNSKIKLSDGRTLGYKSLVLADGALSMARKMLGLGTDKLAFGIEAYVPADRLRVESVNLYFDYLKDGYAWAFPHGDTVCVGAADRCNKKEDYRAILTRVLKDLGVEPNPEAYIGAFLPYGHLPAQDRLPQNIMLAGDAGGYADPISGEGLYMALQTGIYAAEAMKTDSPKKTYLQSTARLERIIKDGLNTQKMLYNPLLHKRFLSGVEGRQGLVAYFFENMVEDYRYEYREVLKLLSNYGKKK